MARFIVAAVLVLGLGGCTADDGRGSAVEAGILMSMGEEVAGQGRDQGKYYPMETTVAAGASYWADDHTLPARIYHLPEYRGEINLPFQDLSVFDVTSASRPDRGLMERSRPPSEELVAPRMSPAVAKISPPLEPRVSGGVARTSYLIQLGALPSKDSARREWTRIERRHPDLVRNRFPTIIPVELNPEMGKVFRLRTGPIGEIKTARSLCREFRSHGQDCFVVKFEDPS